MVTVILVVVVVFPILFEVVDVVDPVTVPIVHSSPSAMTILSTVTTVTEVHDFGGAPLFHPFKLTVSEFIRTRREGASEYVVAVFSPVDECDDDLFRWFKEIFKRSLVNEVGPVRYDNSEWVFQRAQIALDMIEYVLVSLAENTPMKLISRKPRNRREGV
jgi:hypothetical protein